MYFDGVLNGKNGEFSPPLPSQHPTSIARITLGAGACKLRPGAQLGAVANGLAGAKCALPFVTLKVCLYLYVYVYVYVYKI